MYLHICETELGFFVLTGFFYEFLNESNVCTYVTDQVCYIRHAGVTVHGYVNESYSNDEDDSTWTDQSSGIYVVSTHYKVSCGGGLIYL